MITIKFLAIGDELLNGTTADKNLIWLGSFLRKNGHELYGGEIIRDREIAMVESITNSYHNFQVTIISGGLGPTKDDRTKEVLGKCFKQSLVKDQQAAKVARANYENKGLSWSEGHNAYDIIPKSFLPLNNSAGLAPGLVKIDLENKKLLLALPGVPREFESMVNEHLVSLLKSLGLFSENENRSVSIRSKGIPEEKIFSELCPELWQDLEKFGKVQSLPHRSGVDIVVSKEVSVGEKKLFESKIINFIEKSSLAPYVWQYGDLPHEEFLVEMAREKNLSLSSAESCTGGLLSASITKVPGSSKVFKGSFVTYANEAKTSLLDIPDNLLRDKGAVSAEVVELMAKNSRQKLNTDLSLAISGIAGPDGGSEEKPVGLVHFALATANGVYCVEKTFKGDRNLIQTRARDFALYLLIDKIKQLKE